MPLKQRTASLSEARCCWVGVTTKLGRSTATFFLHTEFPTLGDIWPMIGIHYTALLHFGILLSACATQRTDDTQELINSKASVPAVAPDTTPAWFHDDTSYTKSAPHHIKHMVGVTFRDGVSQTDRQAAVDAVRGKVVGGWRYAPTLEGVYAVQVDDGGDLLKHQQLIERLRALPQVKAATQLEAVGVMQGGDSVIPHGGDSTH